MAGQDYQHEMARWIFTVNPPTAFNVKWLISLLLNNDMKRSCNNFPVLTTYCTRKNADGKMSCSKCISKAALLDCHEVKTDYFLVACSAYLLHIARTRREVHKISII